MIEDVVEELETEWKILRDALECIAVIPVGFTLERCVDNAKAVHKITADALEKVRKM